MPVEDMKVKGMIHIPRTAWYICPGCNREIAASAKSIEAGLCPGCLVKADMERTRAKHLRGGETRLCPGCGKAELPARRRYCPTCADKKRKETNREATKRRRGRVAAGVSAVNLAGMQQTAEKPANGGSVLLAPTYPPKEAISRD